MHMAEGGSNTTANGTTCSSRHTLGYKREWNLEFPWLDLVCDKTGLGRVVECYVICVSDTVQV